MSIAQSTAPRTATAPVHADLKPSDVRVLLDLEVSEHVVYGFSCSLDLPPDVASRLLVAAQDERSDWANDNEDAWLDELPVVGAGGVVEVTERTVICHSVRVIPIGGTCVRQDRARLAAAVALVFAELGDDAAERFEALALDSGLLLRCECGWNLDVDELRCDQCRRPAPVG